MVQEELGRVVGLAVRVAVLAWAAGAGAGVAWGQTPALHMVQPSGPQMATRAFDLARTGSALAGTMLGTGPTGTQGAFRWTASAGRVDLPFESANGISQDGNTVLDASGSFARLWDPVLGVRQIAAPSGVSLDTASGRSAVSNSGDWIIATGSPGVDRLRPYRWTTTSGWSVLPGSYRQYTQINDITPSGQAWAGTTLDLNGGAAFVHRNGIQTSLSFEPLGLNDTASVVVGYTTVGPGINYRATVLSPSGQITLPSISGFDVGLIASDVSNDGRVVVGRAFGSGPVDADVFYWTPDTGSRLLRDVLADAGVVFPEVTAVFNVQVDATGSVISGILDERNGFTRAFVAVIPSPGVLSIAMLGSIGVVRRKRK